MLEFFTKLFTPVFITLGLVNPAPVIPEQPQPVVQREIIREETLDIETTEDQEVSEEATEEIIVEIKPEPIIEKPVVTPKPIYIPPVVTPKPIYIPPVVAQEVEEIIPIKAPEVIIQQEEIIIEPIVDTTLQKRYYDQFYIEYEDAISGIETIQESLERTKEIAERNEILCKSEYDSSYSLLESNHVMEIRSLSQGSMMGTSTGQLNSLKYEQELELKNLENELSRCISKYNYDDELHRELKIHQRDLKNLERKIDIDNAEESLEKLRTITDKVLRLIQ